MIMALCDRFHKLPSEVMEEPAGILRLLALAAISPPKPAEDVGDDDRW